jgi:hypothetical protein
MKKHLAFVLLLAAACGLDDFDTQAVLNSVRILAARADKPYAAPGDTVTVEVLAHDGRKDRSRAMKIYWVPIVCTNPKDDLYYLCFRNFAQLGAGGGDGGTTPRPPPEGFDLTPYLSEGSKYTFTLPADIIATHQPTPGAVAPYGLAVLFNIACAGRIRTLPIDPENASPQSLPIGCFDDDGNRLGPDDFVIGITRVYAYETLRNQNPVIDGLRFLDQPVDLAAGITVDRCTAKDKADCPKHKLEVIVPASSQEVNPGDVVAEGTPRNEVIWASWFTTKGDVEFPDRLLFDSKVGLVPKSENNLIPFGDPGDGVIFAVVRDNRGGAAWVEVPVHIK